MLQLLIEEGLRQREICLLNLEHLASTSLSIPESDQVFSSRVETVSLAEAYVVARAAFVEQYRNRDELLQADAPLLISSMLGRMTERGTRKWLTTLCESAEIAHVTFHDLRTTFISGLWSKVGDPKQVMERARLDSMGAAARHFR